MGVTQQRALEAVFAQRHNGEVLQQLYFERGRTIFFPGDPAEQVYFLLKGAVKLSRFYQTGEETTVCLLKEQSVFGVLSFINGNRSDRFYHAVALTPVELVSMPSAQVVKALKEDAEVAAMVLRGLSARVLQTQRIVEALAQRDIGSRLKRFLLILCRDFGVPGTEGITIRLKLSHQEIAEAIGATRVTVTRLLAQLREQALISIDNKQITVYNLVALE